MTWLQLLLKLAADLRSGNGEAKSTLLLLLAALFGVTITLPPAVGTMTASAQAQTEAADAIDAFVAENNLNAAGAQAIGDGVLLGRIIELLKIILPIFIKP